MNPVMPTTAPMMTVVVRVVLGFEVLGVLALARFWLISLSVSVSVGVGRACN